MAKRGQKNSHRVRFTWSNGIKGVISCSGLDLAMLKADEIRRAGELATDRDVTVTIEKV